MNELHRQARAALPNFPEGLFEFWMDEYLNQIGTLPPTDHRKLAQSRWHGLLLQQPLEFWQRVRWQSEYRFISLVQFEMFDMMQICSIIQTSQCSGSVPPTLPADTRERFKFHRDYFHKQRAFIAPSALLRADSGKFRVLDGFHRISAFIALTKGDECSVFVGYPREFQAGRGE